MIGLISSGRRRHPPLSGWHAAIPAEDLGAHGAGYPLTYHFTTPSEGELTAQYRTSVMEQWQDIPAAPAGRFDGETVARLTTGHAYLSVPFAEESPDLYLRIVDTEGTQVGTFSDVTANYDDRAAAVVFTYDDNSTESEQAAAATVHRATQLWMSPGLNPGLWAAEPWLPGMQRAFVENLVAQGYVEPANHTMDHANSGEWADITEARYQVGEAARILGEIQPAQSRGRCLGYYYPNGAFNEMAYQVCGEAGHLSARLVGQGTYTRNAWNETYGLVTGQVPSIAPGSYSTPPPTETQQVEADELVPAVNYAKSIGGQCIVYSYVRYWTWESGNPWPDALATVGAMTDIWSVGYGHLALYQRTRERVTVTDVTP